MRQFCFITDLHITSSSRVRTGDVVEDVASKLQFVVDYCNANDAILLIGGDIFDKPCVPDFVKSRMAPIFKQLKNPVYAIPGNHSMLYSNPEYTYKTSYAVWVSHGILNDLEQGDVDLGDCVLTSKLPLTTKGKPQILVYHGFLNKEDGPWSVHFDELVTSDPTYVLLGHDHVVYEPVELSPTVKVFRPGSLLRGIRNDEQLRVPQILHIRLKDNKFQYKMAPISCRDSYEIFKSKESKISNSEHKNTYDVIINQIRSAQSSDLSFEEALHQVTTPDVASFILKSAAQAKLDNSIKSKNL